MTMLPDPSLEQAPETKARVIMQLDAVRRDFLPSTDVFDRIGRKLKGQKPPAPIQAVMGVDLEIHHGEVLAIVGESGCGKTTLGRILTGIIPPTAGRVLYEGHDTARMQGAMRHRYELAVQMIFQDPFSSLNPA